MKSDCKICKGRGFTILDEAATICSCREQEKHDLLLKARAERSGLPTPKFSPEDYIGKKSFNELRKLKYIVSNFDKVCEAHFYVWGDNSTQKTTMTCWAGAELLLRKHSVGYITMDALIKGLQLENYPEEGGNKSSFSSQELMGKEFLIIDESFDDTKVLLYKSGYQISFLDGFLRERLERVRASTLFISNKPVESIIDKFGKSIQELVTRSTVGNVLHFQDKVDLNTDIHKSIWRD